MSGVSHYLTPTTGHHELGLVCLCAGFAPIIRTRPRPRILDCFVGILFTEGRGWLQYADNEYADSELHELTAPVLFWLSPGMPHIYTANPPGAVHYWVHFDGTAVAAYEEFGYLSRRRPVVAVADVVPLQQAFTEVIAACSREAPQVDPVIHAAAKVHQLLVTARQCQVEDAQGPILTALRRDACRRLSIAEHAERLGMSVKTLRTAVRSASGSGPKGYLIGQRISVAKELLADSGLNIAAVARRVGYDDPAYFSRLFAERVGLSPSEFRVQEQR